VGALVERVQPQPALCGVERRVERALLPLGLARCRATHSSNPGASRSENPSRNSPRQSAAASASRSTARRGSRAEAARAASTWRVSSSNEPPTSKASTPRSARQWGASPASSSAPRSAASV
jgi:hypothetical protein